MPHSKKLKNPLVSIIIPCYNQGEFLKEAIQSVEFNGYSPIEIILVDDASTDPETPQIIAQLEPSHSWVKYIRLPKNSGVSYARNTGIKASSWEYIICLDADDKLHPGCIHTSLKILIAHPEAGFVYGNYQCFGDVDFYMQLGRFSETRLLCGFLPISPASMFRKSAWQSVGGFDEDRRLFVEDWEFWFRLHKAGMTGIYEGFTAVDRRAHSVRKHGISRYEEAIKNSFTTTWYSFKKHRDFRIFLHGWHMITDQFMTVIIHFTKKTKLYPYISPIWRKYILRMPQPK